MKAFAAATKDLESQLKEAEQRFLKAEADKSEAAQEEARKDLQRIRSTRRRG